LGYLSVKWLSILLEDDTIDDPELYFFGVIYFPIALILTCFFTLDYIFILPKRIKRRITKFHSQQKIDDILQGEPLLTQETCRLIL